MNRGVLFLMVAIICNASANLLIKVGMSRLNAEEGVLKILSRAILQPALWVPGGTCVAPCCTATLLAWRSIWVLRGLGMRPQRWRTGCLPFQRSRSATGLALAREVFSGPCGWSSWSRGGCDLVCWAWLLPQLPSAASDGGIAASSLSSLQRSSRVWLPICGGWAL